MTSEQPDKYAYCENENNQTVIFPQTFRQFVDYILTLLGDNMPCNETIAIFQRLHHLESQNLKNKNVKNYTISKQNSLFDCLNGPELLQTIDRKHLWQYTSFGANKIITWVPKVDFQQRITIWNFQNDR